MHFEVIVPDAKDKMCLLCRNVWSITQL